MRHESAKTGRVVLGTALATFLALAGCGAGSGPARHDLSGTVTYGGQPVPAGSIVFTPSGPAAKRGPGAQAEIKDGRYQTLAGQGTIGGPHSVTINGFDGKPYQSGPVTIPVGKPLFMNFQTHVDLPEKTATQDFAVPRDSRHGSGQGIDAAR